jgi:hypothetical protein
LVPASQEPPRHTVEAEAIAQAPLPLQPPGEQYASGPVPVLQPPCGSGWPAVTKLQVPRVAATLQLMQVPVHAVSQQTPWAQWVLAHSPSPLQIAPFAFGPHDMLLQVFDPEHCPLVVVHCW